MESKQDIKLIAVAMKNVVTMSRKNVYSVSLYLVEGV